MLFKIFNVITLTIKNIFKKFIKIHIQTQNQLNKRGQRSVSMESVPVMMAQSHVKIIFLLKLN